jgi:hypothetical protein
MPAAKSADAPAAKMSAATEAATVRKGRCRYRCGGRSENK